MMFLNNVHQGRRTLVRKCDNPEHSTGSEADLASKITGSLKKKGRSRELTG
jgi:hypothetical protein